MKIEGAFSLTVESEQDILLLAELLQRKKGGLVPNGDKARYHTYHAQMGSKRPQQTSLETDIKVRELLKENFPSGIFETKQANQLVKKRLSFSRSTVGNIIRNLVKVGELNRIDKGRFSFHTPAAGKGDYHPNEDLLIDLATDKPGSLLEVCRLARALSNELPLIIDGNGIYSKLSDGHGQIMLDVKVDKSVFAYYHVKRPIEIKADSTALYARLERSSQGQLHVSINQDSSPLLIGNYELKLDSLRDFDVKVVPQDNDVKAMSELLIDRQALERILSDNTVNCQHIDIIADKDRIAFESHSEQGDFKPEPIVKDYNCSEPSRSRLHYTEVLLKCLKAAKCDKVKLGIGQFLHVEFLIDPAVKLSLYLATKKEEQLIQSAM